MKYVRRLGAVVCVAAALLWVARALDAHNFWVVPSAFAAAEPASSPAGDSADVAAVVTQYQAALAAGDSAAALRLLAPDVLILETGGVQTREEYRAGHLSADMNFARGVPAVRANMRVVVRGDAAWVTSTSTSRGEFRGRQINSAGAELMVLSREADGWKIRAIHWSSRNLTRTP